MKKENKKTFTITKLEDGRIIVWENHPFWEPTKIESTSKMIFLDLSRDGKAN